jgi:UDP-glucose 4-epimerase
VNDLCRTAFIEKKIVLKSDGRATRDFIHYKDIFNVIQLLINHNTNNLNNIFHLSSGTTTTILQIVDKVKLIYKERYGYDIPAIVPKSKESTLKNSNETYIISNNKIKSIGFKQEIDLETGIHELFGYLENNEN